MINKLNYSFHTDEYGPFISVNLPYITSIEYWTSKDPYLLNSELNQFDLNSISEVVKEIEEVKIKEKESTHFWFELTFIWVYQKWKSYYWKKNIDSEVTISYGHDNEYTFTWLKIEDILKMMTDYRDYVDAWEKETGLVKK